MSLRMRNFVIFSVLFLLYQTQCTYSENIDRYLNEQSEIVSKRLSRQISTSKGSVDVTFSNRKNLGKNNSRDAVIFTLSNSSFLYLNGDLFEIYPDNLRYQFSIKLDADLIKAVEFGNYSLIFTSGQSRMNAKIHSFSRNKSDIILIQTIDHTNISDVLFFTNRNCLYLIIANNLTATTLYKFSGSHFDEIEKIKTKGATRLLSFSTDSATEIVIILQNLPSRHVSSPIYEFKFDKMRKIQKIDTYKPTNIVTYSEDNIKRFLVIFENVDKATLYSWTGSELLFWEEFTILPTEHQIVLYSNSTPFITASANGSLIVMTLDHHEISPIIESQFQSESEKFIAISNYNRTSIITIGGAKNDSITIEHLKINVQINSSNVEKDEEEILVCLSNVELTAYKVRAKLAEIKDKTNQSRASETGTSTFRDKANRTESDLIILESRVSASKAIINNNYVLNPKADTLVVGLRTILKQSLNANNVIGNEVRFRELNGKKWPPNQLLSYTKPQIITGKVKGKNLKVERLHAVNSTLFKDLALNGGNNQTWTGNVKIRDFFNAEDVKTDTENPQKSTSEVKTFKNLRIKDARVNFFNDKHESEVTSTVIKTPSSRYVFSSNLQVDNLIVDSINNVAYDDFRNSVFRIGLNDTIKGNLLFESLFVKNATFSRLGDIPTDQLLTKSTNQAISSSFKVNTIVAKNVNAGSVNNVMRFGKNVAASNANNIIKGPVKINNLTVMKNLEMKAPLNPSFLLKDKSHVLGTNESDLLQIYNGKILIKGNLYLNELSLIKGSKISVAGEEFNLQEIEEYWMKSKEQTIPKHFNAENGVYTTHLYTKILNNNDIGDYLLNCDQEGRKPTQFVFENVSITGDVTLLNGHEHVPNLKEIEENAVKTTGKFRLSGVKTYRENIKIENLEANQVDGTEVTQVFNDKLATRIFGGKSLKNVIVEGKLSTQLASVDNINRINLIQLKNGTIFIDENLEISEMNFENLSVKHLKVDTINNVNVTERILKNKIIENGERLDKVVISGNATIKKALNVSRINNIEIEALLNTGLKYRDNVVFGEVEFEDVVNVRDLVVEVINDVDFSNLTRRILYNKWSQSITKPYTFRRLKTRNLVASQVNNITISNIVDISSKSHQNIVVPGGLTISKSTIGHLSGELECDLIEALDNLKTPQIRSLRKLTVAGDLTLWDKHSDLSNIFKNIVRGDSDNIITGKMVFSQHTCAGNITSTRNINNVNIQDIVDDAVLMNSSEEQVISGCITLTNLNANSARAPKINTTTVNRIDIEEIDSKIVTMNSPEVIRGRKVFFAGLQTYKLESELVSNVDPSALVTVGSDRSIPNTIFENIKVFNDLNVNFINFMPVNKILNERIVLNSTKPQQVDGDFVFIDNIEFGNVISPNINKIDLADVVFDDGQQVVKGQKKFMREVKVFGNLKVDSINGLPISELYEKAILHEDTYFEGNLIFSSPSRMNANITAVSINNFPVNYMLDIVNTSVIATEAEEMEKIKRKMEKFIYKYFNKASNMSSAYLYLEKSSDMQISIPGTISAQAIETKGNILVHVGAQEAGEACGLPKSCKCPVQHTIQISPEKSVNSFINKGFQRIYSYYDDDVMAHLITNSISNRFECRPIDLNRTLNEVSYLTWSITPRTNRKGGFYAYKEIINGYISGVEFFTIHNNTYVVIGKYYDPVVNSHDLNCAVLKFTEEKTNIKEIQSIGGTEIGPISLFYTSQGVVLLIASSKCTKIMRFDHKTERFTLLRELPLFSPIALAGVAMDDDSLIILGDNQKNLQILKYNKEFDNYYFYQNLQINEQISAISVFYSKHYGISQDAFITVVTDNDRFLIYQFKFIEGLKLQSNGQIDGIQALIPITIDHKPYLFAPSSATSSLLTVVNYNSN